MIPVTKPFLPPEKEFNDLVAGIWKRNWLTNNGPLLNELELRLKEYLRLQHLLILGNGTIALQVAIKALELSGEILTTPFSYVATTSSIVWEGCHPVFVDIDPLTLNIDPAKLEGAITEKTSAILATHVFGNPCDVESIEGIAVKYGLKVIYDAAHCFGTELNGRSILEYGDISAISFHATKLFHTVEGGAVVSRDPTLIRKMALLRNFGHNGPDKISGVGINGKNSEFHAAMGLCNLRYMEEIRTRRKEQFLYYRKKLNALNVSIQELTDPDNYNYAYFPIIFDSQESLIIAKSKLEGSNIQTRRYFYPSLSSLDYIVEHKSTPNADDISRRVLCLPLYHDLSNEEIDLVCRLLLRNQRYPH